MEFSADEVIRVVAAMRTELNRDALLLGALGQGALRNYSAGGAELSHAANTLMLAKDSLNTAIIELGGRPLPS